MACPFSPAQHNQLVCQDRIPSAAKWEKVHIDQLVCQQWMNIQCMFPTVEQCTTSQLISDITDWGHCVMILFSLQLFLTDIEV